MDDDETMKVLRSLLDLSHVPTGPPGRAIEQAVSAARWVRVDEELGELLADSADEPALAGVRGATGEATMMTYRFDDLTVVCEVGSEGLWGQIESGAAPPGLRLELVTPDGTATPLEVDAHGRFMVTQMPPGPVCVRCRRDGRRAITPWFVA